MTPQQIKANAPEGKWHIGRYATYIFYASVVIFFVLGFVLGLLFHPIIYR